MAIRDRNGNLRGRAGDKINRVVHNRNVVQAIPEYVNQTQHTKNCGREWGLVSSTGKVIRRAMNYICEFYDTGITNRLNVAIKNAVTASEKEILQRDLHDGDLTCLSGFQFNVQSPLDKVLKVRPIVSVDENYTISVSLPAFEGKPNLMLPKSQSLRHCSLCISLTAFNLREEYFIRMKPIEAEIKQGQNEGTEWQFTPVIPEGCFLLICMSLHCYTEDSVVGRRYLNGKDWCPAEILGAFHAAEGNTDEASANGLTKDPLHGYLGNQILRNFSNGQFNDQQI